MSDNVLIAVMGLLGLGLAIIGGGMIVSVLIGRRGRK